MSALQLAAKLVAARHDSEAIPDILINGIRDAEDPRILMAETIGLLVGLLHGVGHLTAPGTMMMEVFCRVPDAVEEGRDPQVRVVKASALTDATITSLFEDVTAGTVRADRVWNTRPVPGGMPAVILEGSGIPPRAIIVLDGSPEDVALLREELSARDGR